MEECLLEVKGIEKNISVTWEWRQVFWKERTNVCGRWNNI